MLTAEQIADRCNHLGGSEAWDVLNDPGTVYLRKVFGEQVEVTEDMETGSALEHIPAVRRYIAEHYGEVMRDVEIAIEDTPWVAHLDGLPCRLGSKTILEIKSVGILHPVRSDERWGEAGSDEIPERVIYQVQVYMYAAKGRQAIVLAFIGGRGPVEYLVEYNEPLATAIIEAGNRFWREHVIPRIPPDPSPLSVVESQIVPFLRKAKRKAGEIVLADKAAGQFADMIIDAAGAKRLGERVGERCKALVREAMGENEQVRIRLRDGRVIFASKTPVEPRCCKSCGAEIADGYDRLLIKVLGKGEKVES